MKNFWSKEWRDLEDKLKKFSGELEATIDALDNNPDLQALMGRDSGAIRHERRKIEENGEKSSNMIWQQVSRFRAVAAEVKSKKPTPKRSQEIQGLISEVFVALDSEEDKWESEFKLFNSECKDVIALQRDLNDGDKVRGFDLEENNELDFLLDLSKYQTYIEELEQTMIDNFYTSCQMLKEKRDLEIEAIEQNDVNQGHLVARSYSFHRRDPREF